ncbi:MAG: hypothetical protein PHH04_00425 [Thomasclavelia sp.]|nr:hypothetical protein [Thomasclavelia sp.]
MWIDYLKTIVFFLLFTLFCYSFGLAITKENKKQESKYLLIGYFLYLFPISIYGVIVQLLDASYMMFFIPLVLYIVCLCIFIIYRFKKYNIILFKDGVLDFLKRYWFFLFIIGFFIVCMLCNVGKFWIDNLTDDAYYLVKVGSLPYSSHPFVTDPSTGQIINVSFSYLFNSWEIEASAYAFISTALPTIFIRFGLSAFTMLMICSAVHNFISILLSKLGKIKVKAETIQYLTVIICVMFCTLDFIQSTGIKIILEDNWKNTNALYFGSSFLRLISPFIIGSFFLTYEKLGFKEILIYLILGMDFLSKSSSAIPLFVLCGFVYLLYYLFDKKHYILLFIIIFVFIGTNLLLPNSDAINGYMWNNIMIMNCSSILFYVGYLLLIIYTFIKKNTFLTKLTILIISLSVLMCVPYLNNINNLLSGGYFFPVARNYSTVFYLLVVVGFVLISTTIIKYIKHKTPLFIAFCIAMSSISIYTQSKNIIGSVPNVDLIRSIRTIYHNPQLTPDSTVEVGRHINIISKDLDVPLKVVTLFGMTLIDGYYTYPALTYRIYAPNIINYTAAFRIHTDIKIMGYSYEDQQVLTDFSLNPNMEKYKKVKNILDNNKMDCIVTMSNTAKKYFKKLDYHLYSYIIDNNKSDKFYIYVKNDIITKK